MKYPQTWYCLSYLDDFGDRWFFHSGVLEGPYVSRSFDGANVDTSKDDLLAFLDQWPAFKQTKLAITKIIFN